MKEMQFRQDLYYRLNAFSIWIPPLRERKEDIPVLLENFVFHYAQKINKPVKKIDPQISEALIRYDFPGNIRELKNMVERAVILCDGEMLSLQTFPTVGFPTSETFQKPSEAKVPSELNLQKTLQNTEKRLLLQALEKAQHNKSKAAALLHISRQSLHRRLKRLGLQSE
jgi:transcriptional regulator with PAS, ATPase and Fis domain